MAYTARCEHSDALTDYGRQTAPTTPSPQRIPDGSARAFLKRHADELLAGANNFARHRPPVIEARE